MKWKLKMRKVTLNQEEIQSQRMLILKGAALRSGLLTLQVSNPNLKKVVVKNILGFVYVHKFYMELFLLNKYCDGIPDLYL